MFTIENQELKVSIEAKGAELQSLYHKDYQLEYMWSGDPAFWGKHAPLLFPIVGTLKGNTYYYEGRAYSLPRHGFARDREFTVESQRADSITFLLQSDEQTRAVYPFEFELRVGYRLVSNKVSTTYQIRNPSSEPMYFSVGGHPAFRVPLVPDTEYTDYYLEFDGVERNAPLADLERRPDRMRPAAATAGYRSPFAPERTFCQRCTGPETSDLDGGNAALGSDGARIADGFPGFPFPRDLGRAQCGFCLHRTLVRDRRSDRQ